MSSLLLFPAPWREEVGFGEGVVLEVEDFSGMVERTGEGGVRAAALTAASRFLR